MRKKVKTFSELLEAAPGRWPKKGDRLLKESATWHGGVNFADHAFARDSHIWSGYMSAGAALIDRAIEDDVERFDLVYPILFTYRHGLEAAMKWVLNTYGRYSAIKSYEKNHNLQKLWVACKQVIEEVGGPGDDEALEAVEKIVGEFHALDPASFSFRYSTNKNGKTVKLPDFSIDLANLCDVMEGVNNFFLGVDGQLDANSSAADCDHY